LGHKNDLVPQISLADFGHYDFCFITISSSYKAQESFGTTIRNFNRLVHLTDRGRKRYPERLENLAAISLAFVAYSTRIDDRLRPGAGPVPFAAPAPESCKTRGRRCGHRSGEKPGGFPEAISQYQRITKIKPDNEGKKSGSGA
jgi:hypothetical protein